MRPIKLELKLCLESVPHLPKEKKPRKITDEKQNKNKAKILWGKEELEK